MDHEKGQLYRDADSSEDGSFETSRFLPPADDSIKQCRRWSTAAIARITVEVLISVLLVALFASGSVHLPARASRPRSYGPTLPRKDVILGNTAGLGPELVYNNQEMLWNKTEMHQIHRNWQQLFPKGRGYIKLTDHEDFEVLHPPFAMVDVLVPGDSYQGHIMAVYHQLHCLSILTTSLNTSPQEWLDMAAPIRVHRSHCVEYLRQTILCNADTTVEGETGSWTTSTGWGQTHSCVDFDALTEWANERAIWDLTEELLPVDFDFSKQNQEQKQQEVANGTAVQG